MTTSLPTGACSKRVPADQAGSLLVALGAVPDPRRGGARRHPHAYVLAVLAASFGCAGFESFAAAGQWAAAADPAVLLALGARPDPLTGAVHAPSEATIRRIATRLDAAALEASLAAWTAAHRLASHDSDSGSGGGGGEEQTGRLAVAVDGKTIRGARAGSQRAPHLLAAATHQVPVVLAQRHIPGKTNEIPQVAALIGDLRAAGHDVATMVFTLDALHTQHTTAALLHCAGAGYVMTVKANQPGLLTAVRDQLRTTAPASSFRQGTRGHGRTAEHRIRVVPATDVVFPGAAQLGRIVRYTGGLDGQRTHKQIVHIITNLTAEQADGQKLATLVRGHWSIENSIHWLRDVTYREDASQIRTGNAPVVLAAIRNLVTTALRLAGITNIAAARRAASLNPTSILRHLTRLPKPDKKLL